MVAEAGPPSVYARYSATSERTIFSTDSSVVEPGISNVSRIRTSSSQYSTISSMHDAGWRANQSNATRSPHPTLRQPIPLPQTSFAYTQSSEPAGAPPIERSPSPTLPVARAADFTDDSKNSTFDSSKSRDPSANWFDRLITDWWWWELLSWVVSGLSMGAIVIVLLMHDGQPIPRWRFGITLNAYVAVLAAISRAALILPVSEAIGQLKWLRVRNSVPLIEFHEMDNASRGPWGSFMLMIKSRLRHTAALGAAITVLSLAVEPFFQQIIDYPSRRFEDGIGGVPFAEQYNIRSQQVSLVSPGHNDRIMQAAIEAAFYGTNQTIFKIQPTCATSECAWPAYSSLAVCSSCRDASALLSYGCVKNQGRVFFGRQGPTSGTDIGCGWFVNNTFAVGLYTSNGGTSQALSMSLLPVTTIQNVTRFGGRTDIVDPAWLNSTFFAGIPNVIVEFYAAAILGGPVGALQNNTANLSNCILQWCAKSYDSTYLGGSFEEHTLNTFINSTNEPSAKETANGHPSVIMKLPDSETVFNASNETTTALRTPLLKLLNENHIDIRVFNNTSSQIFRFNGLLNYGNDAPYTIDSHVERLATSMTSAIRMRDPFAQIAVGTAYGMETFVDVRWYWMSLPVTLLVATFGFVAITVVENERHRRPVWKNSALAVAIYGLNDSSRSIFQRVRMSDTEAIAEVEEVRLAMDGPNMSMKIE